MDVLGPGTLASDASRYIVDLLFLCGTTLLLCASAPTIANVLGIVDLPDGRRKRHPHPTPMVGGLAIVAPFVVLCVAIALDRNGDVLYPTLALTAAAFFALGLADDQHHVKPKYRLIVSTVICLIVLYVSPQHFVVDELLFSFLTLPVALYPFSLLFTTVCLVGMLNAMNMADGMNGMTLGACLIWTTLLVFYGPADLQPLLLAFAAAMAITLVFNLRGRLFLGDSGTYAISMVVALLTVYSYNHAPGTLRADIVALWFMVPVLDCLRLMVWRLAAGRSPFTADKHHLHHFLRRWMRPGWAVASYLALIGLPSGLAALAPSWTPVWFVLVFVVYNTIIMRAAWPLMRRYGLRRFLHERRAG